MTEEKRTENAGRTELVGTDWKAPHVETARKTIQPNDIYSPVGHMDIGSDYWIG